MSNIVLEKPLGKADRFKQLVSVETALNKQFSTTNSLVRLDKKVGIPIPSISTGLPTLDWGTLMCGGVPRGRIIELFGPESSGKTTIALHIIAAEQNQDGICAFIDAEHALDPTYATLLGVNVGELLVSQPDNGEQALETALALVESKCVSLIVIDSVAALVPQAELDGDMGDAHVGLQARLMSQAMRKLTGICAKNGVTIIFINQIREKIGVMFGSPETTTGGRALKFYSSVRIDVRRHAKIENGGVLIGHTMKVRAVKNKVGAPFRECFIDLIYDTGIDKVGDLVQYACDLNVIQKAGKWFKFGGENIGDGLANTKEAVRSNEKLQKNIILETEKARKAIHEAAKEA